MVKSPLAKKLLRDLWAMRMQALAIAFVLTGGVATWIISLSTLDSLQATQSLFYAEQRFADVFADAVRAPRSLLERVRSIDGIAQVQSSIRAAANMELPGFAEPITGLAVSLPRTGEPVLNRPYLIAGRWPDGGRYTEVLVSDAFADAHELTPGDVLQLTIEGTRLTARISGVASSPEFIVQIRPGDLFPDYRRYGIVWLREDRLEALTDMDGAFNALALRVHRDASLAHVQERLDALLEPYGGTGAYDRDRQLSHRYLAEELKQLGTLAGIFPLIFMSVAAFLLSLVFGRIVKQEREEIATLKAFGYTNRRIAAHYLLMVLVIVTIGGTLGIAAGGWLARGLAGVYSEFFRFPFLEYRLAPAIGGSGLALTVIASLTGAWRALRSAWRLTPAEAMRPATPERYRAGWLERLRLFARITPVNRVILRHVTRHPLKGALTVAGLAISIAILMVGSFQEDAIDHMTQVQFGLVAREDLTVQFHHPVKVAELEALRRHPAVLALEPFRAVPATLRHGHREMRVAIQAFDTSSGLHRPLDEALAPVAIPENGIVLADYHAQQLNARPGDVIEVELHVGARTSRTVTVRALSREYIGGSVYMNFASLNALLAEPQRADGVFLATTDAAVNGLLRELDDMPAVAGVTRRDVSMQAFDETMGETILVFAFVNTLLAGSIAFGVIYNAVRVSLSERSRELASLRILGFTHREVAWILTGELLLFALLAAPAGLAAGYGLCYLIATRLTSELYRVPLVVEPSTFVFALSVAFTALAVSLLIVRHRTSTLDLIEVLKNRE